MKIQLRFGGKSSMTNAFRMFDKDGDGNISVTEFQKSLHELGMHWSGDDVKAIAGFADSDGSGNIDYNEFASSIQERDTVLDTNNGRDERG